MKLLYGTSERFDIHQSIRQGCPVSPFLFLLVTQIAAMHVKKSAFLGINAMRKDFKICQLADDTAVFLKNQSQVS